jgi:hypothetical protein
MQRVNLRPNGVALDIPPSEVRPEFWTGAVNAVPRDNQMETPRGTLQRFIDPDARVNWLINTVGTKSWWVYVSSTGIVQTDGASSGATINGAGFSTTGSTDWRPDDVCMALINGYPVILVADNAPCHWPQTGNTVPATSDSGSTTWDLGNCRALWVFKNHVFVGDVGGNANAIAWSDAIPPSVSAGTTGFDFYPRATNQAGDADLGEATKIINGLPLGRSCMIYGLSDTYVCDFVGGNNVFSFRLFSGETGAVARHAIADIGNAHVVITQDDIVLNDGRSIQSIADSFARRYFFENYDSDFIRDAWVVHNRRASEVWVGIPASVGGCRETLVYDLTTRKWGIRQTGSRNNAESSLTSVAYGIAEDSSINLTWGTQTDTWATVNFTWDGLGFEGQQETLVGGEQIAVANDGRLVQLNVGTTDSDGDTITTELRRWGMDLGEPETVKTITGIYLNGRFNADTTEIRVRGRMTENSDPAWKPWRGQDVTQNQKYSVFATGRLIDLEMRTSSAAKVAGFTVEVGSVSPY